MAALWRIPGFFNVWTYWSYHWWFRCYFYEHYWELCSDVFYQPIYWFCKLPGYFCLVYVM